MTSGSSFPSPHLFKLIKLIFQGVLDDLIDRLNLPVRLRVIQGQGEVLFYSQLNKES